MRHEQLAYEVKLLVDGQREDFMTKSIDGSASMAPVCVDKDQRSIKATNLTCNAGDPNLSYFKRVYEMFS